MVAGQEARGRTVCTRCVMDTSDPEISFDEHGVCNHCRRYVELAAGELRREPSELDGLVREIKQAGATREYDCVIGISGGVDSTVITALLARRIAGVEAFVVNVGPPSRRKDDLYFAKKAADHIGVPLHVVQVGREEADARLPEAVYAAEDRRWVQVAPTVAQLFLAGAIRERGYRVAFGGEGADELFAS